VPDYQRFYPGKRSTHAKARAVKVFLALAIYLMAQMAARAELYNDPVDEVCG
jgi:hypothetical protein